MLRRGFLQSLTAAIPAALALDPEKALWRPRAKTIFIPAPRPVAAYRLLREVRSVSFRSNLEQNEHGIRVWHRASIEMLIIPGKFSQANELLADAETMAIQGYRVEHPMMDLNLELQGIIESVSIHHEYGSLSKVRVEMRLGQSTNHSIRSQSVDVDRAGREVATAR